MFFSETKMLVYYFFHTMHKNLEINIENKKYSLATIIREREMKTQRLQTCGDWRQAVRENAGCPTRIIHHPRVMRAEQLRNWTGPNRTQTQTRAQDMQDTFNWSQLNWIRPDDRRTRDTTCFRSQRAHLHSFVCPEENNFNEPNQHYWKLETSTVLKRQKQKTNKTFGPLFYKKN